MAIAVEATANASTISNSTSHTVPVPTGISAGERMVAVAVMDGTPTVNDPSGWTRLATQQNTVVGLQMVVWEIRTATGSETNETWTTLSAEESYTVTYRISGHASGSAANVNTISGGSDVGAPDCPASTPSWGSAETLWIAVAGVDTPISLSAQPSGYTDVLRDDTGGSGGVTIGAAYKISTASSENPGAFTGSGAEWAAVTIAVEPASGGGGGSGGPPFIGDMRRRRIHPLLTM